MIHYKLLEIALEYLNDIYSSGVTKERDMLRALIDNQSLDLGEAEDALIEWKSRRKRGKECI